MATGATEFIDNTTADVFIPEIWSMRLIVTRQSALVFGALVDTDYKDGLVFGDTIHVPSLSNLAARSKTANTAITYETNTETKTDITIDQDKYAAIAVESITAVQNNRNQLEMHSGKLAYALALDVDDVLAGLIDDVTNTVGTLAVENDDDDYIRAVQYLDDADVPMENRWFVISNAAQAGLLKLDRYVNADYESIHGSGPATLAVERAYIRNYYDHPVYKSTNVEGTNAAGHDNGLVHKEAFALVMQMAPTLHTQFDIDYIADKLVVENIYGTKEMRDNHAVWIKGA